MQHVGVGEHDVGALADLRARLARRVAVVDRRAHALAQAERGQRARLVLGERLRRIEVERARARLLAEHVERRQVEAHRLARGGAGGDDRRARRRRRRRPRPGGSRAARRRCRASAASTSGCSSGGGSTSFASPGPSRASRTSRPSARPASSSALQGSIWRSLAMGCDSRGDGPAAATSARGSEQRARESAHASIIRHTRASGSRASARERGWACRCACRRANARRRSRRSCGALTPLREAGAIDEIVVVDAASADGTAERRRARRGGGLAGVRAAARARAGARQGRCDVARAVAARAASSCASWTPTASTSRRTSPPGCSGRSCASRACRS